MIVRSRFAISLKCNDCFQLAGWRRTESEAIDAALDLGWLVADPDDWAGFGQPPAFCPDCVAVPVPDRNASDDPTQ